ncbi:MAG: UDP-glucose/GDP-mannose dehydrogenase family protein [Cohaesibacteraceae bacterium]|nr:UDP-glucose/GDP-mannose dehydrogenase family protein [Cohaesibacteraceae bacterium]
MRIAMIGTGYVGLVSGACFSDFGHDVVCVDKDAGKIARLNNGEIPIFEPGLDDLVARNTREKRLTFTTSLPDAMKGADAVFIAVGTPTRRGEGHADLSYVYAAVEELAAEISGYTVIVNKSTVPVGTGDEVEAIIRRVRPDVDFSVVSNPEFLREGAAIDDFKRPDRIVIGTDDERAMEVMREVYRPLYLNKTPMVFTSRRSSELIKYAANAFLAVKISFINEMADLCEAVDANVQDVAWGIGLDKRIGSKFLHAGPGYGGSCFPKDTLALVKTAEQYNSPVAIVESIVAFNAKRKHAMSGRIIAACGGVSGKTIAILGLTFKPDTDDMRDSPSLDIIPALQDAGANIVAYDPQGEEEAKKLLNNVTYFQDTYSCIEGADAAVIVTEWNQFRALDLKRVCELLATPNLIDLRNIYSPQIAQDAGLKYTGIGIKN